MGSSESATHSHVKLAGGLSHHACNRQAQTHKQALKGPKRTYKCNIYNHANDQITQQKSGDYGSSLFAASAVDDAARQAVDCPRQQVKI